MTSDILLTMFNLYATYIYFWLSLILPQSLNLSMMYNDEFGNTRESFIKVVANMEKVKQDLEQYLNHSAKYKLS